MKTANVPHPTAGRYLLPICRSRSRGAFSSTQVFVSLPSIPSVDLSIPLKGFERHGSKPPPPLFTQPKSYGRWLVCLGKKRSHTHTNRRRPKKSRWNSITAADRIGCGEYSKEADYIPLNSRLSNMARRVLGGHSALGDVCRHIPTASQKRPIYLDDLPFGFAPLSISPSDTILLTAPLVFISYNLGP